jgi:imidazole glycerol-phosphate synthase subunit HisH
MAVKIVIVDYKMGNIHSIWKKLDLLKIRPIVSSNYKDIKSADKLILPGVGHFKKAIENLNKLNLIDELQDVVLNKGKPILGICLGMQLMALKSEEGKVKGLGWFEEEVIRFRIQNKNKYKVPHIGWNQIDIKRQSSLLKNISNKAEFYFVHSFHFNNSNKENIISETHYEYTFTSTLEKKNIFGVQYHPEKSHEVGELLLKNFISL